MTFGRWHIPLRVRRIPAPYRNTMEYLDWCAKRFGPQWSAGGKRLRITPPQASFPCPAWPEWHVETFNWFDPNECECPRWHVLQRFHTREEAVAFCERWRAQERADEAADSAAHL